MKPLAARACSLSVLWLLLFSHTISAQTPLASGSASIAGTVRTAEAAPKPAARVIVTVTAAAVPAGRSAITDVDGRFSIGALPAGRYTLTARKPAYLPAAYGTTRPGRAGVEIVLAEGQHMADLSIAITHGAAVSGVIRDVSGQPLPNAQISVLRQGAAGPTPIATATSDDRGHYRVFGLAPGEYLVSALQSSLIVTVAGTLTSAQVDATLDALQRRRASGATPATAAPGPAPTTVNLAPVFYPGVATAAQATPIRLAAGDDRDGADITIQFSRTATLTGTVTFPPGVSAMDLMVMLSPRGATDPIPVGAAITATRPAADGSFRIPSVNPGEYVVTSMMAGPRAGGAPGLWGNVSVDVNGEDVSGVALQLRPMLHFTGRVVLDGTTPPPPDLSGIRVMTHAGLAPPSAVAVGPPIAADGTFDLPINPGTFTIEVSSIPAGWVLRSAVMAGHDALDAPFTVEPEMSEVPPAVVTLTDRHTSLAGVVQTGGTHVASDYFIVAFPSDPSLRHAGSRRVKSTRAGTDGRYGFRDLPAGDYLIAALTDFEPDDLLDSAFFDGLMASALKVSVAEGQDKTLDLRIGG